VVVPLHLAGGDGFEARVLVGADPFLEPPADRQVVDVLIAADGVILTLQRAQI